MKRKSPVSVLSTKAVDDEDVILIDSDNEKELQPPPFKKQDIHTTAKKKPERLTDSIWKTLSKLVDDSSSDDNIVEEDVDVQAIANLYYDFNLQQIEQEISANTILQPSTTQQLLSTSSKDTDLYFQYCIQRYRPPSIDKEQEPQLEPNLLKDNIFFDPKIFSGQQQKDWVKQILNPIHNNSINLLNPNSSQ